MFTAVSFPLALTHHLACGPTGSLLGSSYEKVREAERPCGSPRRAGDRGDRCAGGGGQLSDESQDARLGRAERERDVWHPARVAPRVPAREGESAAARGGAEDPRGPGRAAPQPRCLQG